eukprot:2333715-Prorocentrum_lima.AAC.1
MSVGRERRGIVGHTAKGGRAGELPQGSGHTNATSAKSTGKAPAAKLGGGGPPPRKKPLWLGRPPR